MRALAEELQNISLACRRAGISRSHFYEIKEASEKCGREGLAPQSRRRPRMPNQTPPELEQRILEMTEQYPTYSYLRISQQLRLIGVGVSPFVSRGGRWDSNLTLSAVPTDRARTLRRLHSMAVVSNGHRVQLVESPA